MLDPAAPDQGFAMMQAAFDLSERYHTPVIVRPTTRINHASTFFDVADATDARPVPDEGFERDPKWVIFPRRAYQAHGEINECLAAIAQIWRSSPRWRRSTRWSRAARSRAGMRERMFHVKHSTTGACQKTATSAGAKAVGMSGRVGLRGFRSRAALGHRSGRCVGRPIAAEALRMVGARAAAEHGRGNASVPVLAGGNALPVPEEMAATFAEGLEEVLVLEELDHVLEDALLAHAGRTHASYEVRGHLTGDARDRGENDVDDCAARIALLLRAGRCRVMRPADDSPSVAEPPHRPLPRPRRPLFRSRNWNECFT